DPAGLVDGRAARLGAHLLAGRAAAGAGQLRGAWHASVQGGHRADGGARGHAWAVAGREATRPAYGDFKGGTKYQRLRNVSRRWVTRCRYRVRQSPTS